MADKERVFSAFAAGDNDIGIDLGTLNTVIFRKDKGIVVREPSVVASDNRTDEVLAVGREARDMAGKTPETITLIDAVKSGAVADCSVAAALIKVLLRKAMGSFNVVKPKAVFAVPSGITDVERKAVEDSAKQAGIISVRLLEAPMAAAIGAGLPVGAAKGSMVVTMGAGITEAAVISLGDIVASASVRFGSRDIDDAIRSYIRRTYGLIIGVQTAEEIKMKIGSAAPSEDTYNLFMEVRGRSASEGLPKSYTVQADEIRSVIASSLTQVTEVIVKCLEDLPGELAADILDGGITLTGAPAQLRGIESFLGDETGIKVQVAERPADCVAEGLGKSLELVFDGREARKHSKK